MTRKISIQTTGSHYPAFVGQHILEENLRQILADYCSDKIFALVDENVFKLHWNGFAPLLESMTKHFHFLIIPQGEQSKSTIWWSKIMDFLLMNGARRNTPLIVFGGGVTGDLGGFAAATALRGLPLIHVPTTLLAMVDSSIGGKTGVNHDTGKNLIGSFYQPVSVIADVNFLDTLPDKEWINGLSEILKYGAIRDSEIFNMAEIFLSKNFRTADPATLIRLISTCVQIKADIVEQDEFESGQRAFLNYGHTFAHALEKACNYNTISHGEAVFLGMLAAQKLSVLTGGTLEEDYLDKFRSLYTYRVSKEELSLEKLTEYMQSDKKRTGSGINFVLLEAWQHPILKTVNDEQLISEAWNVVFDEL